jgi:hypothetical protein
MTSTQKVEIVKARYLLLGFHPQSSIGKLSSLKICSDDGECVEECLPGQPWPGASGRKPLVVMGSKVLLRSTTPGPPPEGRSASVDEEWGYRLLVRAPISLDDANTLYKECNKDDTDKRFSRSMCREALMESLNDIADARKYLKNQTVGRKPSTNSSAASA